MIPEENLAILQNLEFSIAMVWRAHPEMTDYSALRAYDAAFKYYRDQSRGRTAKPPELKGLDATAYQALAEMCEIRLGRRAGPSDEKSDIPVVTLERIVECLRELGKSVERHTAISGRRGYLEFIVQFLP